MGFHTTDRETHTSWGLNSIISWFRLLLLLKDVCSRLCYRRSKADAKGCVVKQKIIIIQQADIILQTVLETVRPPAPVNTPKLSHGLIVFAHNGQEHGHQQVTKRLPRSYSEFRTIAGMYGLPYCPGTYFCHNAFFQEKRDRKRLKAGASMWLKSRKYEIGRAHV